MWAAVVIGAFAAVVQPTTPWCGTKDRDIGRGFVFTEYMFDGSAEFTLQYRPPRSATRTRGVSLTGPFELSFIQMRFDVGPDGASSLTGPHIGFTYYPFTKTDSTPFTGTVRLDCGGGPRPSRALHPRNSRQDQRSDSVFGTLAEPARTKLPARTSAERPIRSDF